MAPPTTFFEAFSEMTTFAVPTVGASNLHISTVLLPLLRVVTRVRAVPP
jgi:hypothetical protein